MTRKSSVAPRRYSAMRPFTLDRRRFLGLGAGALAGTALAGCGGSSSTVGSGDGGGDDDGEGLTVWGSNAWTEGDAPFVKALEDYPDAAVTFEQFPANELVDKITTAINGGGGPDVMLLDVSQVTQFGASGLFADVTDRFSSMAGDFFEASVQSAQFDGRQYAVPYDTNNVALFWNKRMLSDAGIDAAPTTWEDLLAAALELTHDEQYGFMMGALGYGAFLWWPWLWQNGGQILSDDLSKAAFNDDAGREAWQFYADLNLVHGVVPPTFLTVTQSWDEYSDPFVREEVAMMTTGSWAMATIDTINPELDYAVAPLPTRSQSATVVGGNALAVSAESANTDAAWKLIEYLAGADQRSVIEEASRMSARRDVLETDYIQNDPILQTFAQQAEIGVARPSIPNWGQIEWGVMAESWDSVIHGEAAPLDALAQAQTEVDKVLAG